MDKAPISISLVYKQTTMPYFECVALGLVIRGTLVGCNRFKIGLLNLFSITNCEFR